MIPGIREGIFANGVFQEGWPSYATLHQATVQFEEMGERTISTQVRIDGSIVPEFDGWALKFRDELFVLPTLKPQASKDNSTKNALIDLVFTSAPIHELKRYFFAEMTEIEQGTIIIDKYVASLRLSLTNFVAAFNRVLQYYFPDGSFVMNLNPSYVDTGELKDFEIDYLYIWDVLLKMNEVYGVTWKSVTSSQGVTTIRVGYDAGSIDGHVFEYGFDGGLLRFERHVEDTDIYNVLLGRGGDKNLPYRYFKEADPFNPIWSADPDAIPELKTLYFSRLLDSNFRKYVQGWKAAHYGDTYDATRAQTDWAYQKGYTDTKFDPPEYVKDDESIALYGVRQGKLDDNDDIFPTIQGVDFPNDNPDLGRVDEVVAVDVTAEDDPKAVFDQKTALDDVLLSVSDSGDFVNKVVRSNYTFVVPDGRVGNIEYAWANEPLTPRGENPTGIINTTESSLMRGIPPIPSGDSAYEALYGISGIPAGTYYLHVRMRIERETGFSQIQGQFGVKSMMLHCTPADGTSYREVFTIWVKNIWQSTQGNDESDLEYAHRIWDPILGDKLGNSAAIHFSDGFMSLSDDYEFLIKKLPEVDRSKSLNGVPSEWKITLLRSDAELETTGLYIPNTETGGLPIAGNHFFFTGIDIPFLYVKWAEERLTRAKEEKLPENSQTNPTWIIGMDKVRVHSLQEDDFGVLLADQLDAGVQLTISDPRFTRNAQGEQSALQLGIRSVTFTWSEPSSDSPGIVPDIEVVLSDKIMHEMSYENVKGDVKYITNNYTTAGEVKNIVKKTKFGIGASISYLGPVIGTVEI